LIATQNRYPLLLIARCRKRPDGPCRCHTSMLWKSGSAAEFLWQSRVINGFSAEARACGKADFRLYTSDLGDK
jgi:hypothetical protein